MCVSSTCGMMLIEQGRSAQRKNFLSAFFAISYTWILVNIKIDLRELGVECVNRNDQW
jgi:hypothetical protein